jgi:hypothetical protein
MLCAPEAAGVLDSLDVQYVSEGGTYIEFQNLFQVLLEVAAIRATWL